MSFNCKRQRVDKSDVDPLDFVHEHLHEHIFQHFDAADVIISSEVSKRWFDVIGGSRKCMKLINLGLENWWQTETPKDFAKVIKICQKTTRKYQNVHFNCNDDPIVSHAAVHLLETLAPSLVDLRFLNADHVTVARQYPFPRLNRLQFINNVADIDDLLLQGTKEVRELNMKHHYWADPEPVLNCLKANKHLTMLKLWDTGISKLFKVYEPNCFQFKLKRFATGADGVISKEAEDNFLHFLQSQSDSLEAIRFRSGLDGVTGAIINKVFELFAMQIIHLDGINDMKDLDLKTNPRVIELRLPWNVDTLEKLMPFVRAIPNVEVLYIRKVSKEILELVATRLKHLRLLYFTKAECCMCCFRKFLTTTDGVNKELKLISKEWY